MYLVPRSNVKQNRHVQKIFTHATMIFYIYIVCQPELNILCRSCCITQSKWHQS
uniref:Uncharacterized protein n=1 Tax=Anguilla anguilla TaxID=7936 RepID=A0A0E9RID4_ANGAN